MKSSLKSNLLLCFFSIVFSVITIEIILSFFYTTPLQKQNSNRHIRLREWTPLYFKYKVPSDDYINRSDKLIKKKYRFEVDQEGYIYPSKIYERPDKTLLFLGGSSTECIYVDQEKRFPYLVSKKFSKNQLKVNSYNSGVSGSNSMHSINILLNKGLMLNPDFCIMMHNLNDLIVLFYEGSYWNDNFSKSLILEIKEKEYRFQNNRLKNIVRSLLPMTYLKLYLLKEKYFKKTIPVELDEFAESRGNALDFYNNKEKILNMFSQSLTTFIKICKSYDITPVLMTQASRFTENLDKNLIEDWSTSINYKDFVPIYNQMNQLIIDTAKSNNVLVIDLAKKVPKNNKYLYDFVHYNDYGSEYAAELIYRELKGQLK